MIPATWREIKMVSIAAARAATIRATPRAKTMGISRATALATPGDLATGIAGITTLS
jgi:hypothetical protein